MKQAGLSYLEIRSDMLTELNYGKWSNKELLE